MSFSLFNPLFISVLSIQNATNQLTLNHQKICDVFLICPPASFALFSPPLSIIIPKYGGNFFVSPLDHHGT